MMVGKVMHDTLRQIIAVTIPNYHAKIDTHSAHTGRESERDTGGSGAHSSDSTSSPARSGLGKEVFRLPAAGSATFASSTPCGRDFRRLPAGCFL